MRNIDVAKSLMGKRGYLDNYEFRNAMAQMRFDSFSKKDQEYFEHIYFESKDLFVRNQILDAFVLQCLNYDLKEFFLKAFKKERYLDTRLIAIRGYASYASEAEVAVLMQKFSELFARGTKSTPYNYKQYEMLRSAFALPYLVNHYGYACFREVEEQVNKQYDAMPDRYKGYFTLDENGILVKLLSNEEIDKKFGSPHM